MNSIYNVVIVGGSGVGKTTLIHKLITGNFKICENKELYSSESYPLAFNTNYGVVTLNVWDGFEKSPIKSDACIIMFDTTFRDTFIDAMSWLELYKDENGISYIILCGNKIDMEGSLKYSDINRLYDNNIPYRSISCKSNYNIHKLFRDVCRKLTNIPKLEFLY